MPALALALALALAPASCGDAGSGGTSDEPTTTDGASDGDASSTATATTAGATTDPLETTGGADDPWASPYCQAVADDRPVNGWLAAWGALEDDMLDEVNKVRSSPTTCGVHGELPAVNPLVMHPKLRCAARNHSLDMSVRGFFGHENPDGELPGDRVEKAGYSYAVAGENLAGGLELETAAKAVAGLLTSDDHCANMMGAQYTEFGAGFFEGDGDLKLYWTQTFARPAGT